MSSLFSEDFKELVRSRTDIVALIGESVALHRRGHDFVGLCPFHDDHRPSMSVYADRQSFRCWSCKEGGDCFSYIMKHERCEFREALEILATRANLSIPASWKQQQPAPGADSKPQLYEVLAWAEAEFHECLLKSPMGERPRNYLAERGLTAETIARFRLGYHPDNWQWLLDRARNRFSPELLHAARLVGEREQSAGYFDNFVDRVLFPIHDERGRAVAFGGRVLPGGDTGHGKYWNSPESVLFSKSRLLYGLDAARDAIIKTETAVVVEGYTDCIMAHQAGLTNFVATLGTAMTEDHVARLKRFARVVVLVYDGDAAGQKATERSLPKLLAQEVDLKVLTLPGGLDPADYLARHGAANLQALIAAAVEAFEFKFRAVIARFGIETIDARARVLREMLDVLSQVQPQVGKGLAGAWQERENIIIGKLSHRLSVSEQVLRKRLFEHRLDKASHLPPGGSAAVAANLTQDADLLPRILPPEIALERELLGIIFTAPEVISVVRGEVAVADFTHPGLKSLLELCYRLAAEGVSPGYERVTTVLEDPRLKSLAALVDQHARQICAGKELLSHTLQSLRRLREMKAPPAAALSGPHLPPSAPDLNAEQKELLRQASEFHLKRSTKITLK